MNRGINRLYGLTTADEEVIQDTLATMMPYEDPQTKAREQASTVELRAFGKRLKELLQPFFDPDGQKVSVTPHEMHVDGWVAFDIATTSTTQGARDDAATAVAAQIADEEGASRLFQPIGLGHLRVAIRNQYRYLTLSRARLCALDVLREHGNVFPIPDAS